LLLCFYLFFIIGKTLLIRTPWQDPLSNIMGGWIIYQVPNGYINAESIENFLFFIPFFILLYLGYPRIVHKKSLIKILLCSLFIGLMISLSIEVLQVIFQRGTFQYADLFYNSSGSVLGGYIYYLIKSFK
ncbi:MAG: VanZ family protein, partial [Coprobacillus sp.]